MRKRYYLSAGAAVALIFIVMLSSVAHASYPSSLKLDITSTSADDQIHGTGIMVLGLSQPASWTYGYSNGFDFVARYDLVVTLTGVPTNPTLFFCEVGMMNPVNPPNAAKQFARETVKTVPSERTANFVCKARWISANPGVGTLDLYYLGPVAASEVGDYVIVITIGVQIGKVFVWGSDLQSLCLLGFSMGSSGWSSLMPDGSTRYGWFNPLGGFSSCQDAAWVQRRYLLVPIPTS